MSKRKKYGIAGCVVWVFITWILGDDQLGLMDDWWDGSFETLVAIIFGWIVVWVLCWAFVKGKNK